MRAVSPSFLLTRACCPALSYVAFLERNVAFTSFVAHGVHLAKNKQRSYGMNRSTFVVREKQTQPPEQLGGILFMRGKGWSHTA